METVLQGYEVNPATWFYLSLLLIVAVFFRFKRLWSVRNLDLVLLLLLSPGLLLIKAEGNEVSSQTESEIASSAELNAGDEANLITAERAEQIRNWGYVWLFAVTGLLLLRLFFDVAFTRRPRFEENLNPAGTAFLCVCAFGFLMTKAVTETPPQSSVAAVSHADDMIQRKASNGEAATESEPDAGRTSAILATPIVPLSKAIQSRDPSFRYEWVAVCLMAILSHLSVVLGLIRLGAKHFQDVRIGLSMATLYLLLPCTAYGVANVGEVLPAAFIVWAIVEYRRPVLAGALMGLACGTMYFPVFLLPIWAAFYGRKGGLRFVGSLASVGAVLIGSFLLTSTNIQSFFEQVVGSIDWSVIEFRSGTGTGFWEWHSDAYRRPVIVAFFVMLAVLTFFPRKKNIEHLLASSTAVIVATQLWYPRNGGAYLLWYLPLMLIVVFRPRLTQLVPPESDPPVSQAHASPVKNEPKPAFSGAGRSRLFR